MNKRRPIRKKVRNVALMISMVSLLITSTLGIFSMMLIKNDSEEALIHQVEQDLMNIVISRARLADNELAKYVNHLQTIADYISMLYRSAGALAGRYVAPVTAKNTGKYIMQRALANRDVSIANIRLELITLGNAEYIWKPIMDRNSDIVASLFLATKTGLMLSYDKQTPLAVPMDGDTDMYYDFTSTKWYTKARATKKLCFTDIYLDAFDNGMMITCAVPFYNAMREFAGVAGMDILVPNLYRTIMNIDFGEGVHAFIIDREGHIIEPLDHYDLANHSIYYDDTMDFSIANEILTTNEGVLLSENNIYYAYTTISGTGWKLCARVPESMILTTVQSVDRNVAVTILLFVLAFIVVTAFVALWCKKLSDRLTIPITALGKDVEMISDGSLDYQARVYDNDEIGDLARGFNNMAISLKEYIKDFASVTAERERIGAELNIAKSIQAELLPCNFPPFPGRNEFDIYATMDPAKEVGGDFYDFFFIDYDHLALVIADVSGKGIPAALFMAISKTLIKNRAQMGGTPSEILSVVNNQLCEYGSRSELFVTVWLGILEISTGKIVASNAGHEYPAIRRAGGSYKLMKLPNNPAVATLEGINFREDKFTLRRGDSLFIYTDGVAEATRINGKHEELYGTERMIDALSRHAEEPVDKLLVSMRREVDEFAGDAPQFDDITMLALQYYGEWR